MERQFILGEIHRLAKNGKAPGQRLFTSETGIKPHEWQGKFWARWGDALSEAGFPENEWQTAHEEPLIIESLLQLTHKLGKFPTKYDISLARKSDPTIPGHKAISHLCTRSELKEKLIHHCRNHEKYADLENIVQTISIPLIAESDDRDSLAEATTTDGYVYLVKAQSSYKIGSTRAPYRRVSEIANQSAKGAELLHLISTDDPEGIEQYWHKRFDAKRINGVNKQSGEWFALSIEDIKTFKRRKTM